MKKVEQLLLLLTAAGAGGPDISAVGEDLLQRASTAANAEVIDHLNCLRAAVESIADSKTTDVVMQRHMTTLQDSMLQLHDRNMYALQQGCAALQQNLGTGIEAVKDSMYELQLTVRSFSEQMLARQHDMHADLKHIKAHLAQLCGVPAAAAQSMDSGRILTVNSLRQRSWQHAAVVEVTHDVHGTWGGVHAQSASWFDTALYCAA